MPLADITPKHDSDLGAAWCLSVKQAAWVQHETLRMAGRHPAANQCVLLAVAGPRYWPGFGIGLDMYAPLLLPPDGAGIGLDVDTPLLLPADGGEIGADKFTPLLLPPTDGRGPGLDVDIPLLPPPDGPPPPLRRSIAELLSMGFDE